MPVVSKAAAIAASLAAVLAVSIAVPAFAQDAAPPSEEPALERHPGPRHPVLMVGLRQVVEASGIDASEFQEGFAAGKSINDTLTANGLDPAAVLDAVLANLEEKLDALVAAGELARERADAMLARAKDRLEAFMSAVPDPARIHRPILRFFAGKTVLESAAQTIGITLRELIGELIASNGTIASVATAHAVDPQDVIDDAVQKTDEVIARAEEIGRITEERARQLREQVIERVTEFVNEGPKLRPPLEHLRDRGPFARDR
jgi:hypothetical protein